MTEEFNLTGNPEKVALVLKLIKHTVKDTWQRDESMYDLNITVHEDDVDDLYEACDQADVEIELI